MLVEASLSHSTAFSDKRGDTAEIPTPKRSTTNGVVACDTSAIICRFFSSPTTIPEIVSTILEILSALTGRVVPQDPPC